MGFPDIRRLDGEPDFGPWQKRRLSFLELAQDARTCYIYITAFKNDTAAGGR